MKMQQKLSPQQLLLMQLIQMPVIELEQRLKEEVEKNPVLEVSERSNEMMESLPETDSNGYDPAGEDTDDDDYSYRERQERIRMFMRRFTYRKSHFLTICWDSWICGR